MGSESETRTSTGLPELSSTRMSDERRVERSSEATRGLTTSSARWTDL